MFITIDKLNNFFIQLSYDASSTSINPSPELNKVR